MDELMPLLYNFLREETLTAYLGKTDSLLELLNQAGRYEIRAETLCFLAGVRLGRDHEVGEEVFHIPGILEPTGTV